MSMAARDRINRLFDLETMIDYYLDVYLKVLISQTR